MQMQRGLSCHQLPATTNYSCKLIINHRGGNPQPEAIGHTRTRLQPESGDWYHAQAAALTTNK